jgi:hypothetical protein
MRFGEYRRFDAVALAGLVGKGEVSAGELLDVAIVRADAVNPKINAIVHKQYEQARATIGKGLLHGLLAGGISFAQICVLAKSGRLSQKACRYCCASDEFVLRRRSSMRCANSRSPGEILASCSAFLNALLKFFRIAIVADQGKESVPVIRMPY